jgi:LuxR family maltose regulon positive regulatory protein
MALSILATKLYIPQPRSKIVPRTRLIDRLNKGLEGKLTLISAPAGFGKTTLISEWVATCKLPVAWLSLDERDNDPARFISYLVKALQTITPGIGEGLLAVLQSPHPLQIETILTNLLNEISVLTEDFLLVLDDYHSIDSPPVDDSLAFFIENQSHQIHLLIATREDPDLPLARLRVRGQFTELRAADLRFTPTEAAEFLNRVMGLNLCEGDVAALEARTEGWIAGLQLAALSMRGNQDATGFIQSFTGSHRFVMDYLLEEVLNQQAESIQTFLLRTSVLDRMCGPLCDAVLLDPSIPGQATLEYLERANLFVVAQDNERHWYRYHHLFGDLLSRQLQQNFSPGGIAKLHILASEWYENNDLILESFRHAAAANDIERAERLMESKKMPIHLRGTATAILDWLESLPKSLLDAKPMLWWKQAAMLLVIGETSGVEQKLQAAEAAIASASILSSEQEEITRDLIGKIAAARATLAQTQLQIEAIFVQARRALEYLHPNNLSDRSSASCALGYAYFWVEDWDEANRAYAEALSLAQTDRDIPNSILASIRLGQLQKDQSHFYLAVETYKHALQLLGENSDPNAVVAYLGLAEIFYKWNNLDTAEQYAERGIKLAQQYAEIYDRIIMSELHLAIIKIAQRDMPSAVQLVSQAERISRQKNFTPRQPNIAYFQTWIYLHQGDLDKAAQLARQNDLPLMLARVLIRQSDPSAALEVTEPLRQEAESKGLGSRLLEVMAVQSIALFSLGEKEKALIILGDVLGRAEPEGYIRLFVDEGPLMAELLYVAAQQGVRPGYVKKLLAAFEAEPKGEQPVPSVPKAHRSPTGSALVEPLSERELEVLKLLRTELTGPEIARECMVSLSTVRTHIQHIYAKLGVSNRRAAVNRAVELNLL